MDGGCTDERVDECVCVGVGCGWWMMNDGYLERRRSESLDQSPVTFRTVFASSTCLNVIFVRVRLVRSGLGGGEASTSFHPLHLTHSRQH